VKLEENFKLEEQIMSKDKYPSIFLMSNGGFKKKKKNVEAIICLLSFNFHNKSDPENRGLYKL